MSTQTWFEESQSIHTLFTRYNQRRLEYLRKQLPVRKREVFDLLPLLLHEESPELPGNDVLGTPPSGISCLEYSSAIKTLAPRYFPAYTLKQRAKPALPIVFLAIMGSAGTLAFSGNSDIDFWVGVDAAKLDADALGSLEAKLRVVERWAFDESELEIHFFIADLEKIRNNDYGDLGGESCGSALGKLLKDEFYRTAIFLEGKLPYYWMVPAGLDDQTYAARIAALAADAAFKAAYYVDLGNVGAIAPGEYYGAALWQILKGLHSPFKSALKIGLLLQYTDSKGSALPLCEEHKRKLLADPASVPDPYLFMVESVRGYFLRIGQDGHKRLMEECFLIKNLLTSREADTEGKGMRAIFAALGKQWGWDGKALEEIALFREWDFGRTDQLRKQILSFFMAAYKRISKLPDLATQSISSRDLSVLGKKLSCFFEIKPGKIPYEFSLLEAKNMSALAVEEQLLPYNKSEWAVRIRIRGARTPGMQALKAFPSAAECLAWCSLNRFYAPHLNFTVKGRTKFSSEDALHLIRSMAGFFPIAQAIDIPAQGALETPRMTHLYCVPNFTQPDWQHGCISVHAFFQNTAGELLWAYHHGEDCLQWLVTEVLVQRVGRENIAALRLAVHMPREKISTRRKIHEKLESDLKAVIARMAEQRAS